MASPPRSSQPSPSLFPVQLGRQRDESDGDDVEDDTADAMRFEPRSKLTRRSDTGLRQRWEAAVSGERRGSSGYATPPGIVSGGGVDSLPPGTVQPVITGGLGLMGISSSTSAPPSRYERAPDSGFDVNILSTDGEEPVCHARLPICPLRPSASSHSSTSLPFRPDRHVHTQHSSRPRFSDRHHHRGPFSKPSPLHRWCFSF